MNDIFVLGKTSKREVTIVSNNRRFIQNEYFIIEDEFLGDVVGEVIETTSYPFSSNSILPNGCTVEQIERLNLDSNRLINIAKLKLLEVFQEPITPSSHVREPKFNEIEKYLIPTVPKKGLLLGIINGTENLQKDLPKDYFNIAPLWENGKAINQKGVPFAINHRDFREYPGVGFFGGSGSGKTYALRVACEELMKKSIPAIALDPHNELNFKEFMNGMNDFEELKIDYSEKYEIFEIGKNIGINFTDLSKNELQSLIEFTDQLSQPMVSALEGIYERGDTYNALLSRLKKIKVVMDKMESQTRSKYNDTFISEDEQLLYLKYKDRIASSLTINGLIWRLEGLYSTGIFTCNILELEKCLKERKLAIIRSNNSKLLMVASYIFKKLYYKRRRYKDLNDEKFPPFIIIIDEAHIFAPVDKNKNLPTKKILKEIAQEARKYGVFQILCTQRPALLDKTIVSQLNTKCIFRTKDIDDISVLAKEANLDEDSIKTLPDLKSGHCYISSATLNKTFSIRFRTTITQSPHQDNPFDELEDYCSFENKEIEEYILNKLPFNSLKLKELHLALVNDFGEQYTMQDILSIIKNLTDRNIIKAQKSIVGIQYKKND